MSTFKKINSKILAKNGPELTADNIYWKNYSESVLIKEFGQIDYIDFSPVEPYNFAVTRFCQVQIYNPITKLVTKNINKFKEVAYGGTFRRDGQLLCAGGKEAVVKLFNVNTKSLLRIFSGHKEAVHRSFFTLDGHHIVSFSDDKTTAVWDIASEKQIINFNEHTDYIRAGNVSPVSPNIYISGGYDKIINMYDIRTNKKVLSVNHDSPVESVLFLPSGGIFLSAGGTEIKVWDCLSNGRLLAKISQHHKTITCLQIACNGQRIISGSLDRHVKVYDAGTYKTLHTFNYANSILSVGISADNKTIVAGMTDGIISIKQKEENIKEKSLNPKKISYKYAGDNTLHYPHIDAYVPEVKKEIQAKHDAFLRKFQYSKALDSVMMSYVVNKSPHVSVALFQELIRRQGLAQALAGRDGKSLMNILKFLIRYIGNVRFGRILLQVTNILIDIYEDKLEELCLEAQATFKLLQKKLKDEQELILLLIELQGSFEMILSAAETSIPTIKDSCKFIPSTTAQKDLILNV